MQVENISNRKYLMQMWVAAIHLLFLGKKNEEDAQDVVEQGARTFLTIGFVHPVGRKGWAACL